MISILKIYLCIRALKYLNATKGLVSLEAAMLIGIYDPSIDVLCIQTHL